MDELKTEPHNVLGDWAIRHRVVLFCCSFVLLLLGGIYARQLRYDQSIESLYAVDNPHLAAYRDSKRLFGGDEFVIIAYADPHLLDGDSGLLTKAASERLQKLSAQFNKVKGINSDSTQNLALLTDKVNEVVDTIAARKGGLLGAFKPIATKRLYQQVHGVLIGTVVENSSDDSPQDESPSTDSKPAPKKQVTAIVLRLLPEDDSRVSRGDTIAKIRSIAKTFGDEENLSVSIVGEPVQVHDMFRYVEEDGDTLFYWSLCLLASVLLLLFRSLRWVLLPLMVVVATLVWTQSFWVLIDAKLSMVSSMLNSLVTIVGVATVMHIAVHYREARYERSRIEALRVTFQELLPAICWTCGTTAVGFAALLVSDVSPIQSFGLMMTLAVLTVMVSVLCILPGGILLGRFDVDPQRVPAEKMLADLLVRSTIFIQKYRLPIAVTMFGVMAISAMGLRRLSVETDFSKSFRQSSPIVQSLDFVETHLGGAGTWEVNFPAPSTLNETYLKDVRKFTKELREKFVDSPDAEITKIIAITDAVDSIPRLLSPTLKERLRMVDDLQPELIPSLYNSEERRMRVVLRAKEQQQSQKKLALIARVDQFAKKWWRENAAAAATKADAAQNETATAPEVKTAGLYVLLAFLIDNLLEDQLFSFGLAALGIVLMMTIAFRSPVIGLISLLPNIFPILLVIGGMGWLDIPVNIGTAMIASVSLGLTVDSSIHYITGYRRARLQGLSVQESLQKTQDRVGRALLFANLALIVGFSVLTLSQFIPLVYFGILVSASMIGGLIGNLVLLPLLLQAVDRQSA